MSVRITELVGRRVVRWIWCAASALAFVLVAPVGAHAATYTSGAGELPFYRFQEFPVNDRMTVKVNVATGNLMLTAQDLEIAGTGMSLSLERSFNSLSANAVGMVGRRQTMSMGQDVRLEIAVDGSATYRSSSGFAAPFVKQADGSFTSPTGIKATLSKNTDGTYRLRWHASEQRDNFASTGALSSREDLNGDKLTYAYTGGLLASITDTQGRVTRLTYVAGLLASVADPAGRSLAYHYDSNQNLLSFVDAAGKSTMFKYDSSDQLIEITDPVGTRTEIGYDSARRAIRIERPLAGPVWTFAYSAGSTVLTDPRSNATTFSFDGENRVTKVVDARGKARTWTYTADSDVAKEISPSNQATGKADAFGYTAQNDLSSATRPAGAASSLSYDNAGLPHFPTSVTNAQGTKTTSTYDTFGNMTVVSGGTAAENQTLLDYNGTGAAAQCASVATDTGPKGTLRCARDANANETVYRYDAKGNLTSIDRPAPLGDEALSYDAVSRVTSFTDGKGQQRTMTYDPLDRVTKVTYADGLSVAYAYDANGNQTSRTDATGTTTYSFDSRNRLTRERFPDDRRIDYDYDSANNLVTLTDEGGAVNYAYGPSNLLSSLTEPGAQQTTFDYDDNANRTATHYPNGVTMTERPDASDQLLEITSRNSAGAALRSFTYSYTDALSRARDLRQTVIDNIASKTTTYGYDGLDRLKQAQTKTTAGTITEDYSYGYDANSNRLSETVTGTDLTRSTTYTYGAANEMTRAGSATYAYDADGNQTSNSAGQAFVYNTKNQATSYTPLGGGPLGQNFLGEGQAERTMEGSTRLQYSQLLGLGTRAESTGTTSFTRDPGGRLIGERRPDGRYYYLFDGLGSITGLTNSSGALVRTYRYEPYGTQRETTGVGPQTAFRYASGYLMPGGLYHFGQRYTDTSTGRWTQQDPLDRASDLREGNRYLYTGDDPINLTDSTGLTLLRDLVDRAGSLVRAGGTALNKRLFCTGAIITLTAAGAVGGGLGGAALGAAGGGLLCGALHVSLFLRDRR